MQLQSRDKVTKNGKRVNKKFNKLIACHISIRGIITFDKSNS